MDINFIKENSPIITLIFLVILFLIALFKRYFEKFGEILANTNNIKTLRDELKENTKIVETIKHEYSKNLEDYKKEIELLNFKLKLKGNDEYILAKKIALNLLEIKYTFPYIKSSINNGFSDEEILKHFQIDKSKEKFTHYDLYYFRVLYLMKDIHKQVVDLNVNSYEAEIYWEEEEYKIIKNIIHQYEDFRRNLEWYRYSGNQAEKYLSIANNDNDELSEYYEAEFKEYMDDVSSSIKFLNTKDDKQIIFLNEIDKCLEILKSKIKSNFDQSILNNKK